MVIPAPGASPKMSSVATTRREAEATTILEAFGWEAADMGKVEAARAIEPLCMLWCIPGLSGGSWSHAFKLLRA